LVIPIAVVVWLCSGFAIVDSREVGVVQRFGNVQSELAPGMHYVFPYPIDRVTRLRPQEIRVVELGYRTEQAVQGLEWSSSHQAGTRRVADESTMITGDGYLLDLAAGIRYQVSDPTQFLFTSADVDPILRSVFESVIRETLASQSFVSLLTTRRATVEIEVLERVQARLSNLHPDGLGIRLEGLSIHDIHPPQEVVASFHAVATAIQEKQRKINDATSLAKRKRVQAEEEALRVVNEAESVSHERVRMAEAWNSISNEWIEYRTMLSEAEKQANPTAKQQQLLLAKKQRVSEYRLTLETLAAVLEKRDKVLVEGDIPKGRRTYFLVNPDFLKPIITLPRPGVSNDEP
jgi:regulator of protease activity HflC (stomatin/prohibitin superfamily)